jgi:magnesium-dependent phosphatase 1
LEFVVFDLDYTLWDAGGTWCDCLTPPFRRNGERVLDCHDGHVRLYEDVPEIMDALDAAGIPMGLASRTNEPGWARELLDLLGVRSRFEIEEIYPGEKTRHFGELQRKSGVSPERMLFFDDESRNIRAVGQLGVACVEVRSGMNWEVFRRGLCAL